MNILSIDGGGIRGIIPAIILSEFERRSGKKIHELFDLISGTSTGGLLALGLTIDDGQNKAKYTAKDLIEIYENQGQEIFDRNTWHRFRSAGNILEEKYPNHGLVKIVDNYFQDSMLSEALSDVLITSYETERRIPWFFKSINAKKRGPDYNFKIRDVALATTAAPTYFEPHKIVIDGGYLSLIDGGIYANNPSLCAYVDAVDPDKFGTDEKDILFVSLGTGQFTRRYEHGKIVKWGLLSWAQPVLNCAFDGMSDTVDYQLSKIVPTSQYFRFQAELTSANDDMDDATPSNIKALKYIAEDIIRVNSAQIDQILNKLC